MRPKSYRLIEKTCDSCRHVFVLEEQDCEDELFCTRLSQRPVPCGSIALGEDFAYDDATKTYRSNEETARLGEAWDRWAKEHEVSPCGACDDWERRSMTTVIVTKE